MIRRYLGPVLAVFAAALFYTWVVSPWVGSLRDDLVFLRAARMSEMQRQMQAAQQRQAPPAHKE